MKLEVSSLDNKVLKEINLRKDIFGLPFREDIIYRMLRYQSAKRQSGNHKTKGISEISGTTKKPFKQKGTGSARQGSKRSPQMRGGAVIFGPQVRSHAHKLPKKIRSLALKIALSKKFSDGKIKIINEAKIKDIKTTSLKNKITRRSPKRSRFEKAYYNSPATRKIDIESTQAASLIQAIWRGKAYREGKLFFYQFS